MKPGNTIPSYFIASTPYAICIICQATMQDTWVKGVDHLVVEHSFYASPIAHYATSTKIYQKTRVIR